MAALDAETAQVQRRPHVVRAKGSEERSTQGVINKGQKGPAHSSKSELELERETRTSTPLGNETRGRPRWDKGPGRSLGCPL